MLKCEVNLNMRDSRYYTVLDQDSGTLLVGSGSGLNTLIRRQNYS